MKIEKIIIVRVVSIVGLVLAMIFLYKTFIHQAGGWELQVKEDLYIVIGYILFILSPYYRLYHILPKGVNWVISYWPVVIIIVIGLLFQYMALVSYGHATMGIIIIGAILQHWSIWFVKGMWREENTNNKII